MKLPYFHGLFGAIFLVFGATMQISIAEDKFAVASAFKSYNCAAVAIQRVLDEFNTEESIIQINSELMSDSNSVPSMFDMMKLLQSRGVSVIATHLKSDDRIDNDFFAIVHLPNVSEVGHFAVILPNTYDPTAKTYEVAMNKGLSKRLRLDELDASPEILLASNRKFPAKPKWLKSLQQGCHFVIMASICLAIGTVCLSILRKGTTL